MIWDEVHQEFNTKTFTFRNQLFKVLHCPVIGMNLIVIRNIVSSIDQRTLSWIWIMNTNNDTPKNWIFWVFKRNLCKKFSNTLNIGAIHNPSTPISFKYSNLEVIPFKSPIPSPSLSLNDLDFTQEHFFQHLTIKRKCFWLLPGPNFIKIRTFIPFIGRIRIYTGRKWCQN